MNKIKFSDIFVDSGFWKVKEDMIRDKTIFSVYERFKETGRFDALSCSWKEKDPNMPHIFWDSDVAKWIEGVSYFLIRKRNKELEKIIDNAVDMIVKNSDSDGYFNSHFLVTRQNERFCHRSEHELYCAGHLIEAAVAYYNATGKDKFLKAMCRYADYIERVFKTEKSSKFATPGHPELELALVRLYETTGERRYLDLSKYFIDEHGKNKCDLEFYPDFNELYNQDEMPLKERSTAEGHCVRALYLFCAMADNAALFNDKELMAACVRVFDNIANKRMYITGSVGSTYIGEAFTIDYDLPNRTAYAETCAAISLAMFAGRMQALSDDSKYADVVERAVYNGVLSGISMDGRAFFYENPLEVDPEFNNVNTSTKIKEHFPITERKEVFDCSCCPPNILRFIPSFCGYMYNYDDKTLFVHHYIASDADDGSVSISQTTDYPRSGNIIIKGNAGGRTVALRIPGWCKTFKIDKEYQFNKGYAYIKTAGDFEITLNLEMSVLLIQANKRVHADAGRIALMRGPVVYCAEGVDNPKDLQSVRIDIKSDFELGDEEFLLPSVITKGYQEQESESLYLPANENYIKTPIKFIPYYAFANRGTTQMCIWMLKN